MSLHPEVEERTRGESVRGGLTTLLLVLATITAAIALPASWVALNVASESGFVSLADAISSDDEVQTALAEVLTEELLSGVDLPSALEDRAGELVRDNVDETLADEGFRAAWQDTLRLTHRNTLEGASPDGVLRLELAPFADLVAERAGTIAQPPDSLPVEIENGPSRESVDAIDSSRMIAFVCAVLTILLTVGALVLAPRRSRAVAGLGLGMVVSAAVVWLGVRLVLLPATDAGTDAQADLARAFVEVATRSLDLWLLVVGAVGVVALVVGWTVSAAGNARRRRRRRPPAPRSAWPVV